PHRSASRMRAWPLRRCACDAAAGPTSSMTRRAPTLPLGSGCRSKDLLQSFEQRLMLLDGADGDADPARDRLSIVMADEGLALAPRADHLRRGAWRARENEVGRGGNDFESHRRQGCGELRSVADDLVDELAMVLLVFDGGHSGGDGQPVDVVGVLHGVERFD